MDTLMRTRANGLEFAYRIHGHGPTLVLLHAFPFNQRMWDAQIEALSDRCQVITIDLRGFGSSQTVDGVFTLDELAEDVHQLLHTLGYGHVVLGGLSMGGYVALAYARRFGAHLRGLVLADTKAGADQPAAREKRLAMIARLRAGQLSKIAKEIPPAQLAAGAAPALVETLEDWIAETNPDAIIGAQRAMAERPDSTPFLGQIAVPTLVLVGELDPTTPVSEARIMAERIPNATLVTIPGAGHLSNMEQPEAFNRAVGEFMARFPD
jgi:pimeloyl-ACP methyl ester carboxylesterase